MTPDPPDLGDVMGSWMGSTLKVQVLAFYHSNPGLIETVDGLAQRLGVPVEALEPAIEDHVQLGLIRKRQAGDKTVLVYDKARDNEVQGELVRALAERREGVSS